MIANTTAEIPTVKVIMPAQSIGRAWRSRDSRTRSAVAAIARMPTGTLTKKIQRQLAPAISPPPTNGPRAIASPAAAPNMPNAMPRDFPWNSCPSRAGPVANSMAAPTP
jgi:hypothetical protein